MKENSSPESPNNLVYHSGALGDFITTYPAIACWRRRFPDDDILFVGPLPHGDLVLRSGVVDQLWNIDSAGAGRLFRPGPAPEGLEGLERALLFARPESPLETVLRDWGCREVVRQDPFPAEPIAILDYHLSLFPDPPPREALYAPLRALAAGEAGLIPGGAADILIHPGSGGRAKVWPSGRFLELGARLKKRGRAIRWCLGPADGGFPVPAEDPVELNPPLRRLCGLLHQSRIYIGNDSGVSHLAAALEIPSVTIFGPSDSRVWKPAGERAAVVSPIDPEGRPIQGPVDRVSVDQVLRAFADIVSIIP